MFILTQKNYDNMWAKLLDKKHLYINNFRSNYFTNNCVY